MIPARRPLEDMIGDLADDLIGMAAVAGGRVGLRATGIDLVLPVETRVERGSHGPRIVADMPRTHTRTDFDLPVGRLTLRLAEAVPEALS